MSTLDWQILGPLISTCILAMVTLYGLLRSAPTSKRQVEILDRDSLERIIGRLRETVGRLNETLDKLRDELEVERTGHRVCEEKQFQLAHEIERMKGDANLMAIEVAKLRSQVAVIRQQYPEIPKALGWA